MLKQLLMTAVAHDHFPVLRQADGAGAGAAAAALAAGSAGGAANTGGAAGGNAGAAGGGGTGNADASSAGGAPAAAAGNGAGAGDAKPWYEGRTWTDPALQQHLIKSGYHKGTPEEALERALKGELTATTRLGRDPAKLLDAPAEGQSALDWMKANAKAFGVPDAPDKYDVKLPDNLPKDMPINEKLLTSFKAHAHGKGYPTALVQDAVQFFATEVGGDFTGLQAKAAQAEEALTTTLKSDWGGNYQTNQQQAVRAFHAIAADMKLNPDQAKLLADKLNEGMGDATLLKFFHSLAQKMGEDTLAIPKGGNAPQLQLADAQQRKEVIMASHSGEMAQAVKTGDRAKIAALRKELEGLNVVIAQHSR